MVDFVFSDSFTSRDEARTFCAALARAPGVAHARVRRDRYSRAWIVEYVPIA